MRVGLVLAALVVGVVACSAFGGDSSSSSSSGSAEGADASSASTAGGQPGVLCNDPVRCTGTDKCCVVPGKDPVCAAQCGDTSAAPLACDDTVDCAASGLVCCIQHNEAFLLGASCRAACTGTDLHACSVASECGPGKGCVPYKSVINAQFYPDHLFLVCEQP